MAQSDVRVVLTANADQMRKTIDRQQKQLGNLRKRNTALATSNKKLGRSFGSLAGSISPVSLGLTGLAVGGLRAINNFRRQYDEIGKLSKSYGIGVETLQRWEHTAKLSGTTLTAFAKGAKNLSGVILDANDGMVSYQRAFDHLGLSWAGLAKLTPEEQMNAVADALSQIEDRSKRTALAQDLLGRAGVGLLAVFGDQKGQLAELNDELSDGAVLTKEQIQAVEDFNDALVNLSATIKGEVFTAFSQMVEGYREQRAEIEELLSIIPGVDVRQTPEDLFGYDIDNPNVISGPQADLRRKFYATYGTTTPEFKSLGIGVRAADTNRNLPGPTGDPRSVGDEFGTGLISIGMINATINRKLAGVTLGAGGKLVDPTSSTGSIGPDLGSQSKRAYGNAYEQATTRALREAMRTENFTLATDTAEAIHSSAITGARQLETEGEIFAAVQSANFELIDALFDIDEAAADLLEATEQAAADLLEATERAAADQLEAEERASAEQASLTQQLIDEARAQTQLLAAQGDDFLTQALLAGPAGEKFKQDLALIQLGSLGGRGIASRNFEAGAITEEKFSMILDSIARREEEAINATQQFYANDPGNLNTFASFPELFVTIKSDDKPDRRVRAEAGPVQGRPRGACG